jgi:polar amino acid transport system permease protein
MEIMWQNFVAALPALLSATETTIISSFVAIILALVFAIPAGLGRLSNVPIIRSLSTIYIEVIRGTPLLLQLLVWYFGVRILLLALFNFNVDIAYLNLLTTLNSNSLYPYDTGISSIFFAILGLSFNYGAYLAEVIRAGVLAVDRGQTEAAQSLGLSNSQSMRLVILPQAFRIMLPSMTNNFITLVQDTSFFQILGVTELSLRSQQFAVVQGNPFLRWEFYTIELVIYFAICYSLALVSKRLEARGFMPSPKHGLLAGLRRPAVEVT